MPVVGPNSLEFAAVCQASPLTKIAADTNGYGSSIATELEELSTDSGPDTREYVRARATIAVEDAKAMVYYLLKLGEVKMPEDWQQDVEVDEQST
ncbi:hypothetical protein ColLi_00180 [Colletotrichum liriopes]|uniref:Uncharacterized protein n=1 Tax=Colletotrichum liriopes TaxID=708192 RepID=A0AA37GB52_9PEZI|nr:hypothetical protein ColLi_00180 [Colletotrichum liriopes]